MKIDIKKWLGIIATFIGGVIILFPPWQGILKATDGTTLTKTVRAGYSFLFNPPDIEITIFCGYSHNAFLQAGPNIDWNQYIANLILAVILIATGIWTINLTTKSNLGGN